MTAPRAAGRGPGGATPDGPLFADIGNSALKVAAIDAAGRVRRRARVALAGRAPTLPAWCRGRPVVAVCVAPRHLRAARRALGGGALVLLGRDLPMAVPNRTRRPRETGADRLAAAVAAHARAGGAAIVVGVGTALTVDAVGAEGAFLGGSIGIGPAVASRALAAAAPALRGSSAPGGPRGRPRAPGRTTAGALRAGLLLGTAGAVDRLIAEVRAGAGFESPDAVPVFAAGGDLRPILPLLRTPVTRADDLVLEGVRILWLRAGAAR